NILYHLDKNTSQFSILKEAWEQCSPPAASNETFEKTLSNVLNSIHSAQLFIKAGLDVFESVLVEKN
ncbi:inactive N-acetylated-alpha-linked acidic dipeptidase 2, partial [Sigmodon hispidus]